MIITQLNGVYHYTPSGTLYTQILRRGMWYQNTSDVYSNMPEGTIKSSDWEELI